MSPTLQRALRVASSLPVRALVTVGLLAVLARIIDWEVVRDRISGGEWGWFLGAVALLAVALLVAAVRWYVLLRGSGVPATVADAVRAFFVGTFANNFLPALGGDAVRALIVAEPNQQSRTRAILSALVDRVSAVICLVVVSWAAVVVAAGGVPSSIALALLAVTAVPGAFVTVGALLAKRGRRTLLALLPERLRRSARLVRATLTGYTRDRRLLLTVVALGVLYQVLAVLDTWMLSKAIGLDVSFAVLAAAIPVVLVITMVPISLGGFGLREGGFVVLLAEAGVSSADATLLSLLSVVTLALASLPGAVALLMPGRAARVRARESLPLP